MFRRFQRPQIRDQNRVLRALCVGGVLLMGLATASPALAAKSRSQNSWKSKFDTKLGFAKSYYPKDLGDDIPQGEAVVRGDFEFSLRQRKWFRVKIAPNFYADLESKSAREQFFADLPEAYLEAKAGEWSSAAGIMTQAWGVTDVYNPLDVVNSRRYFDPLNPDKRGAPTVELKYDDGTWSAEALYIPVQFPSVLPGEKSRWLPREVVVNRSADFTDVRLPSNLRYSYADDEVLDDALKNNFGGRLEYHGSGLDLSAIFFQGAPLTPAIFPEITGTVISVSPEIVVALDPDVRLAPVYYMRRTAGGSAVLSLESTIIRFAAAASDRLSSRSDLPGWSQTNILGVERNLAIGSSTLTVLLQGTYGRHEDQADNSITSIERIFDRSFMLGFRLAMPSDWTFSGAALFDSVGQSWLSQAKVETKLSDGFTAQATAEVIEGPSDTPLGAYRNNDRFGLAMTIYW